jgi:hypothetical protein
MPLGVGTQLPVRVCIGGVCGESAALHSYAQPRVESVQFVDGRMQLFGVGFGPLGDVELEIDGAACANAVVVVADRQLECDGVASGESMLLQHSGQRVALLSAPRAAIACGRGAIVDVEPRVLPTDGRSPFALVVSDEFTAASIGESVVVTVGARRAVACRIASADTVLCEAAPAGSGSALPVQLYCPGADASDANGAYNSGRASAPVGYHAPSLASASCAPTAGGKINVFGANFGPSFVLPRVTLRNSNAAAADADVECQVTRSTHERIQCVAPSGTGRSYELRVEVDGQMSAPTAFGYCAPSIEASTRPHWQGGRVYLRGANFGADAALIDVFVDAERCDDVQLDEPHSLLWCRAPPGEDASEHDVVVQVDGLSSDAPAPAGTLEKRDRHRRHRLKYHNHAPVFMPHTGQYTAVACDALKIKLQAHDQDGDYVYFRAGGLPDGASWKNGGDFMQIEYDVPAGLLAWPRTELNITLEAKVTDGPGTTSTSVSVNARACPTTKDTCKDLSCASRTQHCATCPTSNIVRCGAAAPVLDVASGECHTIEAAADVNDVRVGADVVDTGYTIDVSGESVVPLRAVGGGVAGALISTSQLAPSGAQPCGGALTCVDVTTCPADALKALKGRSRSASVQIGSGSSLTRGSLFVGLPLDDASAAIGAAAGDGYGLCLGKWDCEAKQWHCVDESLALRANYLSGGVDGAGCYALLNDNCPDHSNPLQEDRDGDGAGDQCQGGATACENCHSWSAPNVKYIRAKAGGASAPTFAKVDDSAKSQKPYVIVTEEGDKYHVVEN